jgi:hypothetical protein
MRARCAALRGRGRLPLLRHARPAAAHTQACVAHVPILSTYQVVACQAGTQQLRLPKWAWLEETASSNLFCRAPHIPLDWQGRAAGWYTDFRAALIPNALSCRAGRSRGHLAGVWHGLHHPASVPPGSGPHLGAGGGAAIGPHRAPPNLGVPRRRRPATEMPGQRGPPCAPAPHLHMLAAPAPHVKPSRGLAGSRIALTPPPLAWDAGRRLVHGRASTAAEPPAHTRRRAAALSGCHASTRCGWRRRCLRPRCQSSHSSRAGTGGRRSMLSSGAPACPCPGPAPQPKLPQQHLRPPNPQLACAAAARSPSPPARRCARAYQRATARAAPQLPASVTPRAVHGLRPQPPSARPPPGRRRRRAGGCRQRR